MRTISISQEESCDNQVFTIVGDSLDFVKVIIKIIIENFLFKQTKKQLLLLHFPGGYRIYYRR